MRSCRLSSTEKRQTAIIFDKDEHYRPGLTMEQLKALPVGHLFPKSARLQQAIPQGLTTRIRYDHHVGGKSQGIRTEANRHDTFLQHAAAVILP